ncbi:MAG: hypothetical protein ABL931_06220 [Usitatibacteraceae bacterium]
MVLSATVALVCVTSSLSNFRFELVSDNEVASLAATSTPIFVLFAPFETVTV